MATEIGTTVTVRGTDYRVINRRSMSHCGSKFYGRFVYTLADAAGKRFTWYGKTVSHNSKLTEVSGGASVWHATPEDAVWYGEVVIGRDVPGGTDTTYEYGYSTDDDPDVKLLVPDGWSMLESKRNPIQWAGRLWAVDSLPGLAFRHCGFVRSPDYEESGEIDDTQVIVVAVGDDYRHTVPTESLSVLPDGAACGQCGQLGCTHDGR